MLVLSLRLIMILSLIRFAMKEVLLKNSIFILELDLS